MLQSFWDLTSGGGGLSPATAFAGFVPVEPPFRVLADGAPPAVEPPEEPPGEPPVGDPPEPSPVDPGLEFLSAPSPEAPEPFVSAPESFFVVGLEPSEKVFFSNIYLLL